MVFGLFSRKREPTAQTQPDAAPSQLRTPSPSVDSASIGKQHSPSREPPLTPSPPPEPPKQSDLHALIQSIPPQTLHAYTLTRLHPSNPNTIHTDSLAHLAAFFSELAPPPRLHCVRCHKPYFDIENTDRSCFIPHDDDSAEVERVSSKAKGKGTLYETLWGCCGRTVEGDGDMGPPDGWCYEGKHTTDTKRARFRADSTLQDDKLASCGRLRCHEPPRPARGTRKRGRPVADDENENENEESDKDGQSNSSIPSTSVSPRRRTGKKPRTDDPAPASASASDPKENEMDVDVDAAPPSTPPHPAPPFPQAKPKSRAKSKSRPRPKAIAKSQTQTTPNTSSPLVLSTPLVLHSASASPEPAPPSKARVTAKMKPKSSVASLKPKSSAASLKSASRPMVELRASPQRRVRKESSGSGSGSGKPKPKGKTRGLVEVVDSSVDAERGR